MIEVTNLFFSKSLDPLYLCFWQDLSFIFCSLALQENNKKSAVPVLLDLLQKQINVVAADLPRQKMSRLRTRKKNIRPNWMAHLELIGHRASFKLILPRILWKNGHGNGACYLPHPILKRHSILKS